jgi:hypothetical protein
MTKKVDFDIVQPNPGALIESLRAFGYTPESAVADLVDNSIAAGAKHVDIRFEWEGATSRVIISDDGRGMPEAVLVNAMRAGSTSPSEERDPSDLGRFGLGLKTASFSQCRLLTVMSKTKKSPAACRRWDLDEVVRSGEWRLLHGPSEWAQPLVAELEAQACGTKVAWEKMDRLVGDSEVDDSWAQRHFFTVADKVADHLSMTFHRFLNGRKLSITINGHPVDQWDPFLEGNPARQVLGMERIKYTGGEVEVHPYVLPHRSKLADSDFSLAGGSRGWNDLQGFYVYRNQRLLVAGDWLGLRFTKEEHYKLARIRIDIPNNTDEQWQIDVRKSVAVPPPEIREQLRRIAKVTRERAVEVYRHRGKVITKQSEKGITPIWLEKVRHGQISYVINQEHDVVASAIDDPNPKSVRTLIRLIEETIPVPLIAINSAERSQQHAAPLENATPRAIATLAETVYRSVRAKGSSHKVARDRVLTMDPFHLYPELLEVLDSLEHDHEGSK